MRLGTRRIDQVLGGTKGPSPWPLYSNSIELCTVGGAPGKELAGGFLLGKDILPL